jgi:hypothetical protein
MGHGFGPECDLPAGNADPLPGRVRHAFARRPEGAVGKIGLFGHHNNVRVRGEGLFPERFWLAFAGHEH